MKKVLDRFHFENHTACGDDFNPDKVPEMEGIDTQVCERCFSWFACYQRVTRNMNGSRFQMFVLLILAKHNLILINKYHNEYMEALQKQ